MNPHGDMAQRPDQAPSSPARRPVEAPVSLRLGKDRRDRIDAAAARRGMSRSAWITKALDRVLAAEEQRPSS